MTFSDLAVMSACRELGWFAPKAQSKAQYLGWGNVAAAHPLSHTHLSMQTCQAVWFRRPVKFPGLEVEGVSFYSQITDF